MEPSSKIVRRALDFKQLILIVCIDVFVIAFFLQIRKLFYRMFEVVEARRQVRQLLQRS